MPGEPKLPTESVDHKTLADIEPIVQSQVWIESESDFDSVVESPLREACKELFRKGIRTVSSSANFQDLGSGAVHLVIDFDNLSIENQAIASTLGKIHDGGHYAEHEVFIEISVVDDDTIDMISERAQEVVAQFQLQPDYGKEKHERDMALFQVVNGLDEDLQSQDLDYSEGDIEQISDRVELLKFFLTHIELLGNAFLQKYREACAESGIDKERTGKLSIYLVGGRVHRETKLKATSDLDFTIVCEKPFDTAREAYLPTDFEKTLPAAISGRQDRRIFAQKIENMLRDISEQIDINITKMGLFHIMNKGLQRDEEMQKEVEGNRAILISREK